MQQVSHICDKCRSVITEDRTHLKVETGALRRTGLESIDLCADCGQALADLLKAGRPELFALSTR